jgi:hypothetical protein
VNVQFSLIKQSNVMIDIKDIFGRPVTPAINKVMPGGGGNIQIATTAILPGTYFLKLSNGQQARQLKLVVTH